MHRSRFLGLTLAVLVATTGMAGTAQAADSLTGAGSTLVAPLMARWSQDFQSKFNTQVTYGAVGSGAGIAQISARTVDFGASDAPLTAEQASGCNGCVQIPWALTATGIAFNIQGVSRLNLTPKVISAIYQGHITMWNDKSIAKLNKGTKLPALKITPAFRSDGSGDTYAFTDLLSRVDKGWKSKIGYGTQVSFPTGVGGAKNDGIAAVVASTNGSIGYISTAYIIAHGMHAAALQNNAGKFVYPNLKNIKAAASVIKKVPANNEMHIVNPAKSNKLAYPLSTFTYVIAPKSGANNGLLSKFITYAMNDGQKFGPALDFAPLPKVVQQAAAKTLKQLH